MRNFISSLALWLRFPATALLVFFVFILVNTAKADHFSGSAPHIQGAWSVDCSTSAHLWRIYSGNKAIGPVPFLEQVASTDVNNNEIDITYSDGFVDRFQLLSSDRIRYLYQFYPDGSIYRDWEQFGEIILHKCSYHIERTQGIATALRGGWSVNCQRPRDAWRIYTDIEAIGPQSQRYGISSTSQMGPLLRVNHSTGGGEVFVLTSPNQLQYIYDFKGDDIVTRRWLKKGIILYRCEDSSQTFSKNDQIQRSETHSYGGSGVSGAGVYSATRQALADEQARKVIACVASEISSSFATTPEGEAFVGAITTALITGKTPTPQEALFQYAAAKTTHTMKESGWDFLASILKFGLFVDCLVN